MTTVREREISSLVISVICMPSLRDHSHNHLTPPQGGEYRFRSACGRMGIRQPIGRPGSALDNAVIESWHSTLEFELRRLEHYRTRARGSGVHRRLQPQQAPLRTGHAVPIDNEQSA